MRLIHAVIVIAAAGFMAADDPKKDDADALKGNWTAVSIKSDGQDVPADAVQKFKMRFDLKSYTNLNGDEVVEEGGFSIDPSKTPKTMDFDIKKGPEEGKKQLAIYKIEGDKLTIVAAHSGVTERPKSFTSGASDQLIEIVFERAKS